ncbi:MAG: sodium:solute symporter family protein [Woeseiaceae bacterium]|nr:sodium:solute symporter family protein [Woeseiaceae bacterium]
MDIYTLTIGISILVYVAIGNYAGRGIKRLDDYYVAGRRAPTLIIVGTLVASLMSATIFLGEAGFAYAGQAGPYVLFPQTACIGYVLGAILFGRYLRRSRATTVAEFFGARFVSQRVRALAGITIILALGGYLLAVTQGAAILLSQLTGLSYVQALVVAWLSYTAFTMYSGSRGVILTDTLMFLLFASASVGAIVYMVWQFGGWPSVIQGLVALEEKADLMSWHGIVGEGTPWPTAMDYLIWALVIDLAWMVVYAVSPWQASRHLMANNEHVVMRAAIITCVVVALLQVVIYGMGGVINLGKSDVVPDEAATIWGALNLLPPALGAVMLAGIMAAALSSASTFLSLVGFSASSDIGLGRGKDEQATLRFSRLMMLIIGTLALGAALVFPPDIFWLMLFIGTVFASSWGPVGIMSIWSKRITETAAFWGMLAGLVFNVVPKFFQVRGDIVLPSWADPAVIGAVASIAVILAFSARTQPSTQEKDYRARLHRTPASEIDGRMTRQTLWAPLLLFANGIVMPVVLLVWYVRPYQAATGALRADGSIDWMTGEAILALSWFGVYVTLGILAMKAIRRSYLPGE